jgi:mono/diheme cytochrome c family protein
MPSRRFVVGLIAATCLVGVLAVFGPIADGTTVPTATPAPGLRGGKQLYRQFCGQCHALTAALAAGFGSDNGLGRDGGPSFNSLRVPFNMSIVAVTTPFAGHELVFTKLTWSELNQVATFIAVVTKDHIALAKPIDD